MKIVQEMYARGFEFVPIDIYRAKAKMFQIVDGKLMLIQFINAGVQDNALKDYLLRLVMRSLISLLKRWKILMSTVISAV